MERKCLIRTFIVIPLDGLCWLIAGSCISSNVFFPSSSSSSKFFLDIINRQSSHFLLLLYVEGQCQTYGTVTVNHLNQLPHSTLTLKLGVEHFYFVLLSSSSSYFSSISLINTTLPIGSFLHFLFGRQKSYPSTTIRFIMSV